MYSKGELACTVLNRANAMRVWGISVFTTPGVLDPSLALYQKQMVNPTPAAAPVPTSERTSRPAPTLTWKLRPVLVLSRMLLLSSSATPAPANGPVINSDWGLYSAPFVSVRVYPPPLASA